MFQSKLFLATCLMGFVTCVSAAQETQTHVQLVQLAQDMTQTTAKLYPISATMMGITGHDGELEQPSEAYRQHYIGQMNLWQKQLKTIVAGAGKTMSLVDQDDAKLLQSKIARELNQLTIYRQDRKDYGSWALNIVGVIYDQFLHLPVNGVEGASNADVTSAWNDIIARMSKASDYIVRGQRLSTTPGHLFGVISSEQLGGAPEFLNEALTGAAKSQLGEQSAEYRRFVQARDQVLQTLSVTKSYIDAHLKSWPENHTITPETYDMMLRDEQLLPFKSVDVQRMGWDELSHGWAEEAWLKSRSVKSGLPFGPLSGGGIAPDGAALIDYYRDRIADLRKFVVDNDVVTVPAWLGSMKIIETPSFLQSVSPGASMNSPRLFSTSTTGFYFITPPKSLKEAAERLDMNQDFDSDRIMSTAAHEAMPGHFMQLSIAKRHSNYIRRIQESGVFAEGWAFYGEEMFVRLGMYGDNLDGRLFTARWERVRGARAIVDYKFITGEWSYELAAEFYSKQSGFTLDAAKAAVAGIAKNPGYMIAYTVGRLQLQTLLGEYMLRTGANGSLHDFHDRLLSYGTTPFAVVGPELLQDLNKPVQEVRAAANY
ncbi:DUF885 family protein [Solimicrobium silvestre]|uniref:DUF885 domain-containing protein n=1 Tax=Solimicrobium silvestre TaxID=2099400 RepID=A0A2S9GTK3_9BURK|nr:DUF885 family protein [Solimicrobium silvestre]PRC91047.1 hypothetical protein S2091_4235 [Solimicrobium silvestre]